MKKYLRVLVFIGLGLQWLSASAQTNKVTAQALSPVSITDAIVYVPLGKSTSTQAFFKLRNNSKETIHLAKVTSSQVKKISLVPTLASAATAWDIAPGQTLHLKPGQQYLQLEGLKGAMVTGDQLHFEVSFGDGKKILVTALAQSAFDQIHGH